MVPRSDGDRHEPAVSVHAGRSAPRDRPQPGAPGRHAENVLDGCRLVLADLAYNVRALTTSVHDWDVAVAEDGAAGHIPALSLELERITQLATVLATRGAPDRPHGCRT